MGVSKICKAPEKIIKPYIEASGYGEFEGLSPLFLHFQAHL
jgi:hypothetical protein